MTEKTLMRVTAVDYETVKNDSDVVLQVAGRGKDGERKTILVEGTRPHFYMRADVENPDDDVVVRCEDGYESFDGVQLTKVETEIPGNTGPLSEDREAWENDIPYYRRATMDYGLVGHIRIPEGESKCHIDEVETGIDVRGDEQIEPRKFIADIEVLQESGYNDIEEMKEWAEDRISHITVWDSYDDEYYCLLIDPDSDATGGEVKDELEVNADAESMTSELERQIHLRRYDDEKEMLNGFLCLFEEKRPDIISGWNFVDFDWEYILSRFEHLDLNEHRLSDIGYINGYQTARKVDCVPAFDMMNARTTAPYSFSEWRSKSLDYVAKEDLGVGKIPDVDINWAFEHDLSRLTAYNIMDVMLCVGIERAENLHAFFYELAELARVQMYDTAHEMRLVDGYLMSHADDDEILPAMPDDADIPENAGGLVLDASDGIKEWVGVEDLKSLYPSVIITWNISPETILWTDENQRPINSMKVPWMPDADHADGGNIAEEDIRFDEMYTDLSEEGLIPKYIKQLFPRREEKKRLRDEHDPDSQAYKVYDRQQSAVKVIMNSFYGVMSNDYWRLGKYGLGDAVTSTARYALWKGKEVAEDGGYDVYYGDTDSIMLSLGSSDESKEDALTRGHELEETINDRMSECVEASGLVGGHPHLDDDLHGTDQHCLVYEFEKLYRRFFQAGSKKRYAGLIVWKEGKDVEGKIDTVGFESNRSDSPELTSDVQPEVIRRILAGEGFDEVSEYIRGLIDDIEEKNMDLYKTAIPAVLTKPLDEYGNTQTAKACRFANHHLDYNWGKGADPWLYFVRSTPTMMPGTDAVALDWDDDLPDGFELDLDKTLERAIEAPLKPILNEVGWKFAELKQGAKTDSAADDGWATGDWEDEGGEDDEWGW